MPTLEFVCSIAAPLSRVWAVHQDVLVALPALSPPDANVKIEHADIPQQVGSRIIINAKGPIGRIRWVAKIVEVVEPHTVVFGEEARFVDEQESGPFKSWRHEHEFERIDDKTTRMVDRVTYRAPLGPLGWIADWLIIRRQLRKMFAHRHAATKRLLE